MFFSFVSALFNFVFYYVPAGPLSYMCILLKVFGIASQFNTIFVIAEMRIPPANTASALVIILTVGTATAAISPYLAQASAPFPMIISSLLALGNLFLSLGLTEPGLYLPRAMKLSENVTILQLE